MSCQALLTALAVTCTLSRIHAHDLMCVLILSGIQKEDLDVSMLQKLQRHNVNINDMNNEELRRKCKGLDLNFNKGNLTTTEPYTAKEESIFRTNKSLYENFVKGEILQRQVYLDPIQGEENYELESNIENVSTTQTVVVPSKKETINKGDIEYKNGTPKIESVLNFWDKFIKVNKRDSIAITPSNPKIFIRDKSNYGNEQKNKRDVRNESNNDSYIINKMISHYLSQKKNINTDRPSTQGFSFENVYEDKLSPNNGFDKEYKEDVMKNKYNIGNTLEQIESKNFEKNEQKSLYAEMETEEVTTYNPYMSFKDMLAEIDQKTAFPFLDFGPKNYNKYKNIQADTPRVFNDFDLDSLLKPKEVISQNYPQKETSGSFSRDVIKDIAENVKALVLKDLRSEVREPTTQTETTTLLTTSHKYTMTTKKGTIQAVSTKDNAVQESVLNKFLELFEQIKSLKNNPLIITRDYQNRTENKTLTEGFKKEKLKSPTIKNEDNKVNIQKVAPTTAFYNTIKQPYINMPILKPSSTNKLGPIYDFGPQVHKFRSSPLVNTEKTLVKSYVPNKKPIPITFQTNALEIPPLGVYLDKPHDPINQNIIVTTVTPQRLSHKGRYTDHSSPFEMHNDANKVNTYCSTHDCTRIQKSKPRHNSKTLFSNEDPIPMYTYHKNDLNRYMKYTDPVHVEKQMNVPRYYEKLEKMDEELVNKKVYVNNCCGDKYVNSQQISDCCNRKIASRQQISLNPMKRGYDDTHFKNFLKSQQKVTDMLERILAVKNKLHSVETN